MRILFHLETGGQKFRPFFTIWPNVSTENRICGKITFLLFLAVAIAATRTTTKWFIGKYETGERRFWRQNFRSNGRKAEVIINCKRWAIPGLFIVIFVFTIQLRVNK